MDENRRYLIERHGEFKFNTSSCRVNLSPFSLTESLFSGCDKYELLTALYYRTTVIFSARNGQMTIVSKKHFMSER